MAYALRFVSADLKTPADLKTRARGDGDDVFLDITVSTVKDGRELHATAGFTAFALTEHAFVVDVFTDTMRQILTGTLKAGESPRRFMKVPMPHRPIALNCPVCGVPLRFLKTDDSTGLSVELYHCPMHGVYYFDKKGLMPGTPPPR